MLETIKDILRPPRDVCFVLYGFVYDWLRYVRYGGWTGRRTDASVHAFMSAKLYHKLEKSLAMPDRRAGAGWKGARTLARHMNAMPPGAESDVRERAAVGALAAFVAESEEATEVSGGREILEFLKRSAPADSSGVEAGARAVGRAALASGALSDPERFFKSRASVRAFSEQPVSTDTIVRAVKLAQSTPSVCNRQAWHVYGTGVRADIDSVLKYQNGNRGFGHTVPFLLVVTADLRAFDEPGERFQHWIDGGMFSMSLVWALHALGLVSCCLNWSTVPSQDRAVRQAASIHPAHSIIMMIAVGYPLDEVKVCASARRELGDIFSELRVR